jgi:16S rRNA (guanine527-N7)-methyltransferase
MDADIDLILNYFHNITDIQKDMLLKIQPIYAEWNERLNLISRQDIGHLQERHILHSLAIAKFIGFYPGTRILDAGTGGGFPGIPLAILFPESRFLLVDSVGKKINAVKDISHRLGLQNVDTRITRIEKIGEKFDFIVSRAVTDLKQFLRWTDGMIFRTGHNLKPNGILYLKGGDLTSEVEGIERYIEICDISTYFRESFFDSKKIIYIPQTK